MEKVLKNQTAIVTGSTAGIGQAIAELLAQQGAWVAVVGTNNERGQKVVEGINQTTGGNNAVFYNVDVSNTASVEQVLKDILTLRGTVDILVNNAGITKDQLLMKMTEEEWDAVINVNLKSCFNWCKPLSRVMLKARKGRIVNISSVVGITGAAGQVNYASSKAAMIGFTKSLAKELGSRNILVNCVTPGFIETKMTGALADKRKEEVLALIPLGRMGTPQDVANAVLFLVSDLGSYITGQVVTVDGGMVM
jgi:3-oxoacyl-[acyl-carrier protein] reductase